MSLSTVRQLLQLSNDPGIPAGQHRYGNHPPGSQVQLSVPEPDGAVPSQDKGVHVQSFDHGFPGADGDAVPGCHRASVPDNGDIRGGASHIHNHRVRLSGQDASAHHAGRRTRKQGFHRTLPGRFLGHQASVASHDGHRGVNPTLTHHIFHRPEKISDQGNQPGV